VKSVAFKDHVRPISFGSLQLQLRLGLDGQFCGKDEVVVTVIKLIFQVSALI